MRKTRYAALVLAAVGAASSMVPAATTFNGSITLTTPVREQASKGVVEISWVWRTGKYVKSTSKVDLAVTLNGISWYSIGVALPIRGGVSDWDTATWPDGVYAMRATVSKTSIKSVISPIFVDNTAPEVRISRPAEGEVLVENERMVFFAAVVGTARLEADARDALTGIAKIRWLLDGEEIGQGTPLDHNFSMKPGKHVLTSEATDGAGNAATHEITLIAAPGPSAADGAAPGADELPQPDPSETPSPGPLPSEVPPLPDPGPLPSEVPPLPEGIPTP